METVQVELQYNSPVALWGGEYEDTKEEALVNARRDLRIDGVRPDFYSDELPKSEQDEGMAGAVFAHHIVVEIPKNEYGDLDHEALQKSCETLKRHTTAPFPLDNSCEIEHRLVENISLRPEERHIFDWRSKR